MLRAVVFDLDDTLFPERAYVLSGFRAVAQWCEDNCHIQADHAFAEMRSLLDSGVRSYTFDRFCEAHGLDPKEAVPKMMSVYRTHRPELSPYEGVPELLQRCGELYLLGLVSDGLLDVQRAKLQALGIGPLFDGVVFSDQLGREQWKPSTRPFETITQELGVPPEQAVYVGENSLKDFIGARRAGMRTIRVLGPAGFYTHELPPSREHAADLEIDTLAGLEEALAKSG